MEIEIRVVEDRTGAVGIAVSLGALTYVGSIETAERLADTLHEAIREARELRKVGDAKGR